MTRIVLLEGDIAEQRVDAIVNAANSSLRLGSGVAGAIAKRGGPVIQEECLAHGAIKVGEAAVTGAGEMDAKFVIHAAGMALGGQVSEESLRLTLKAALACADEKGCETIALPAIGAGVGGLSLQTCAEISLEEARAYADARTIGGSTGLQEIRFVLFGEPSFRLFEMVNDAAKVEEQMRKLRNR
jgi:O-acetyl-ADP-ribose deacetylase (regulator of RNase III)